MKKITLLLFCGLFSAGLFAQEQKDFNRWSVELQAGVHKPYVPMTAGYGTSTPDFFQGSLGVRYMLSNRFGLKLGVGMSSIQNSDNSLPFKSSYTRISLQGVANVGNILNFSNWTNSINLLVHGGAGYAMLKAKEPIEKDADNMGHFIAGVTPQLKLTDHIVLTGDISAVANIRQDLNWEGVGSNNHRGFDGVMLTGSLGLTFYLGSADVHADWYKGGLADDLAELDGRVSSIEDDMLDSDKDGVANYLDAEPNTVNGVAVDTKGVAVDKNKNGIPDELEGALDARYLSQQTTGGLTIAQLLNKGYVSVYFQFDSNEPTKYSLNAINYLVTYMKENSSANAELIGYADEVGAEDYNKELSLARAEKVKDILVAAGVDAARLSVTAGGEDASVAKDSKSARQLVRRVVFKLK